MATGHTVAPKSNAPLLNMTQYSLLTHVPSGKMSNGVVSGAATCAFIRSPTIFLSFTYRCQMQDSHVRAKHKPCPFSEPYYVIAANAFATLMMSSFLHLHADRIHDALKAIAALQAQL